MPRFVKYPMNKCCRCTHASGDGVCPWAMRFEPVPGWTAEPTVISENQRFREDSFAIYCCPLFEKGHDNPEYNRAEVVKLLSATLRQAVSDWKLLDYGRVESRRISAQVIYAKDLIEFFQSPEFDAMYKYVTHRNPDYARAALKIPTEVME